MKTRVSIWAASGFLIASCFVLFTFLLPPQSLNTILQSSGGKAFAFASCPVLVATGPHFPIEFWWLPPMSALTYAIVGLITELVGRKLGWGLKAHLI